MTDKAKPISKPDETLWKKTIVKYEPFSLTNKQLEKLIKKYMPERN